MARSDQRLLRGHLPDRRAPSANGRSQPHFSHGAVPGWQDRVLAGTDRHLDEHPRRPVSQRLARRERSDQPQQLRRRNPLPARLAQNAPDQRRRAAQELGRLTDWCLTTAIAADGKILARAASEALPESYYFTVAFLDTVGYFEPAKRFWTDRQFLEAPALRARLERQLSALPKGDPMVRMARERLSRSVAAAKQSG